MREEALRALTYRAFRLVQFCALDAPPQILWNERQQFLRVVDSLVSKPPDNGGHRADFPPEAFIQECDEKVYLQTHIEKVQARGYRLSSKELGTLLRGLRHEWAFTLATIADDADVSVSFLSDVERGRSKPSLETLGRIADALGYELYLLGKQQ